MKNILILFILLGSYFSHAQHNMSRYRQHQLQSVVFDTVRDIIIMLPANYDREPNRKYEVLYVLDAQNTGFSTWQRQWLITWMGMISFRL